MGKRETGYSRLEVASVIIALISLAVSIAAGAISINAWKRPFPADPTAIPTFGRNGNPATINSSEGGRAFFAFLDKHAGKKIRIIATMVEEEVNIDPGDASSFSLPHGCKPDEGCELNSLIIYGTGEGKPGLVYSSGIWKINGYFADFGIAAAKQSIVERSITAIDIVTAVS